MRKLTILTILVLLISAMATTLVYSDTAPKKAVFMAPLTWRADEQGQYKFEDNVRLGNADIAKDGSVQTTSDEGICEVRAPYATEGPISTVSVSWQFTGKVTMEVSATGKSEDYKQVTNGVPLDYANLTAGKYLKWRATLGLQSTLTEVRIIYTDLSGVVGSMGNPDLSGFIARKEIFVKGSSQGPLYNYQIPIKVGESQKAGGCDIYLEIPSKADLDDIRFTQGDGETSLSYWREGPTGTRPDRAATYWVKVPEIPKAGLPLYIYYGCPGARDLSDGEKVFDFFDDFKAAQLDNNKWKAVLTSKTGQMNIAGSLLELDSVRATTPKYSLANGIIEYKAKLNGGGNIFGIIAAGNAADTDLAAYSSIAAASAHCITKGDKVMANDPRQIDLDTFYNFRVISNNGEVTFQRYFNDWDNAPQAQVKYSLGGMQAAAPIGISAGAGGKVYCDWIRTRKYVNPPPQIDPDKTGKEEPANLPVFHDLELAPNGSLMLSKEAAEGEYISMLVRTPFEARILTASWAEDASDAGPAKVSISTREDGNFYTGWQNGVARYVSKKEFLKGDQLRWRAKLYRRSLSSPAPRLKKFSLAFQPGTIKVLVPGGGENLMPNAFYNIFWGAAGYEPSYGMNLYYSGDGGVSFQAIALRVPNSGSHTWTVPQQETAKAMIKVADSLDSNVYGVSDSFTISKSAGKTTTGPGEGTAGEEKTAEELAAEEKAKEEAQAPEADVKLYDLLIMRSANPLDPKQEAASIFKDGDIVMIRPAGFLWGAEEIKNFVIIQANLTDSEVKELMKPQEEVRSSGRRGQSASEIVKQRRYKVDLTKKEMLDRGAANMKGHLRGTPLNKKDKQKVIVDKAVSK